MIFEGMARTLRDSVPETDSSAAAGAGAGQAPPDQSSAETEKHVSN
jgi:hypothetical protein